MFITIVDFRKLSFMARTAIIFGLLLAAVTLVTIGCNPNYTSKTVFIPAGIGAFIGGLGLIALKDSLRKHAMHAASVVGLLGGVACLGMGISQLAKLGSETPPTILKIGSVWATALLCLGFLTMCVQSFIQAKRERLAKGGK